MICNERGVKKPSQYFFFSPSEGFLKYNYGIMNLGHFYCQFGYRIERKGNALPLFIYIVDGEFHLNYDSKHYIGNSGDILLINCSKPHTYYVENNCEFLYFHFIGNSAVQVTEHLIQKNNSPLFQIKNTLQLYQSLNDTISKLYYSQTVHDVELSCLVYQCLCTLQATEDIFTTESIYLNDIINKTMIYIKEHLDHKFTLSELSQNVNLSAYYFAHLFKTETGISPIEYATQTKINFAKSILKTTQTPISEITDMLGFSSNASFINAFKKRVGVSPARFRKSNIVS